jgi:tetratricopeptide (TPR) repeat protein
VRAGCKLSLCMIVKDEAEMLPGFLAHSWGLWDQLCVVDTGSTDETVSILRHAGAELIHRPWDQDFSAARNAGLERARGDWILFLDADEMITPELGREIRGVIAADAQAKEVGAATVVMRNLLPHGHRRQTAVLRLFRNDPSLRFSFPIHEDITGAVNGYLQATGRSLRHLVGVVDHLGYLRERASARGKKLRDSEMLLACLERDRADFYSWFKLLELARFWNDRPLWAQGAASAGEALERGGPLSLFGKHFGGELVALIAEGRFAADAGAALRFIGAWADLCDPSAALFLRRGELHELVGDSAAAAADFRRCLDLAATTCDRQLATVRPLMGIARLALAAGDSAEAWRRVQEALGHNPRDPEGLLLALLICRAEGGQGRVEDFARQHRVANGDVDELNQALGEAALLSGDPASAVSALQQAAGTPPGGRPALRLAQALLAAGDIDGAHRLAEELVEALPEAGIGVVVCNLAQGRDTDIDLDLDPETAGQALRAWVDVLRRGRRPDLLAAFRHYAPALTPLFPWLPAAL